jgi:hypothetical protein
MKSFKEVEETRRKYYEDRAVNSVHRSSLLVPRLAGFNTEISFVNHFLLKRDIGRVACRITALDVGGERIESRLFPVTEPRVHRFSLDELFSERSSMYHVEFYCAENLFIPFPAVMINHCGPGFLNTVHAFNRVLNDVFEDEEINAVPTREASFDVRIDEEADTFLLFCTGPQACSGNIEIELATGKEVLAKSVPVQVPRFAHRWISLKQAFPHVAPINGAVVTVGQPRQFLFYGRMLTGIHTREGAISANHTFYDSSSALEYWDNDQPSHRLYPYFPELEARIRMYPIMSPGTLSVHVNLLDAEGRQVGSADAGRLTSPGRTFLETSVTDIIDCAGLDPEDVNAFQVVAQPSEGRTPTRVNHQLIYHARALPSSINVSLVNSNAFWPKNKAGITWGQVPMGGPLESWLGCTPLSREGTPVELEVTFYDESGQFARRTWTLPPGSSKNIHVGSELRKELEGRPEHSDAHHYLWYMARANRSDLSSFVVTRHRDTNHCSGDHGF